MIHLLPGLRKFTNEVFPTQQPMFERLSQGQHPHTLLITCSDSRIDPNLVTQTQPGELFIVRNAGNIVPPYGGTGGGEEAAIEFAVDGLQVSNIVVCGHSHCGAMAALTNPEKIESLPSVSRWLTYAQATKRRLQEAGSNAAPPLSQVIEENVLVQADNLRTHPAVSAALRRERVRIFCWVYHFETGAVTVYDPRSNTFVASTIADTDGRDASVFAV
jgi:carbonic anhydrase